MSGTPRRAGGSLAVARGARRTLVQLPLRGASGSLAVSPGARGTSDSGMRQQRQFLCSLATARGAGRAAHDRVWEYTLVEEEIDGWGGDFRPLFIFGCGGPRPGGDRY